MRQVNKNVPLEEIQEVLEEFSIPYSEAWRIRSPKTQEFTSFIRVLTPSEYHYWSSIVLPFSKFAFDGASPVPFLITLYKEPLYIFNLFFTNDMLDLMAEQRNNYDKDLWRKKRLVRSARITRWYDTDKEEMTKIIGKLLIFFCVGHHCI